LTAPASTIPPFILPAITPTDPSLAHALRLNIDGLAKPPGALGELEALAVRIGAIQGRTDPRIERVRAYVFAGDHGLNAEGVSAYPSTVTAAMVATFLAGKASINALARACGVEVVVVDAGVDATLPVHAGLIDAKIRRGTRNAAVEAALTPAEVGQALARGAALAAAAADEGIDALIPGEMGIGNTASAALIMHRLAPAPLETCIGLGAGHDAAGLVRKTSAIGRAAARSHAQAPLEVLAQFGGLEIVMMTGFILGAAARRRVVIVDGFISTAAALAAIRLTPAVQDYCVFAHASAERGHMALLDALGAQPLLRLEMRLGEGSGAVLAAPLLRAAARLISEVATLDDVLAGRL
jgi:nicotinate-nucleotide--dimethylbenzimidazole phosphoribosyltransferase